MKTKAKEKYFATPSGMIFTSRKGFVDTLFDPIEGKTASGYYKKRKAKGNLILNLYTPDNALFAIAITDGINGQCRTAERLDNGKVWAMHGLSSIDSEKLGMDKLTYSCQSNYWVKIIKNIHAIERE